MTDRTLPLFEEHRQWLFKIAYRMLGSVADAHDMVQETYIRWQQSSDETIRSPRAWLTTVITRLCITHLQLARVKRETYVGQWLPEPLIEEEADDPASTAMLADSLSLGLLVVLETLSPVERAVFILREGFDCEFADIARMVDKSETNCRQILTRARARIDERRPRYEVSRSHADDLVLPFVMALKTGDLSAMVERLAEHVVLIADGGDKPGVLLRPLEGPDAVARGMLHAVRKHGLGADIERATINGLPGFVRYENGEAKAVLAFGTAEGKIHAVFVISNPDKLRHLHRVSPPAA